jgi:hypothetical protein
LFSKDNVPAVLTDGVTNNLTPYASDTCTVPIPYILLGQGIQSMVKKLTQIGIFDDQIETKMIFFEKVVFFAIILICDFLTAFLLSKLVHFYCYYQVPVPSNKDTYDLIKSLRTGTANELEQALRTERDEPIKNQFEISQIFDNKLPSLLFYAYLFNPVTILSSLALNSTHITITIFVTILYLLALPREVQTNEQEKNQNEETENRTALSALNPFMIALSALLHGLLIVIDPSYLALIPGIIAMIAFRKNYESFQSNQKSPQNSPQNSPIFFIFMFYSIIIILIYSFFLLLQHYWSNTLHLLLPSSSPSILTTFTSLPLPAALITFINTKISPLFLHTYSVHFQFSKSRPTLGLLWYFFSQIFDRFRSLYSIIIPAPLLIHSLSLVIRLPQYPFFIIMVTQSLSIIFHPLPTLKHYLFIFFLFILNYPVLRPRLGNLTFLIFAILHFLIGFITMWASWIDLGSGNANFVFFQTILFNAFILLLLLELLTSVRTLTSIPPGLEPGSYNPYLQTPSDLGTITALEAPKQRN